MTPERLITQITSESVTHERLITQITCESMTHSVLLLGLPVSQ